MRRAILLLVPLFLFACDRQPAAPDVSPSFDFANGPAQSGIVSRDAGPAALTFADPATGWRVTFGVDMLEFCAGIINFDELHWADKYLPGDIQRIVSLNKFDEAQTAVWPFLAFDCALFTTVQPVAAGYSTLLWVDNDLTGSANPNTNAWGYMAHGTLAWADGAPARFSFHQRLVWHKDAPTEVVSLKLTLK